MNDQMLERLKNCKSLPTLPGVALQIVELCQDEDLSLSKLAKVLGQDPALCARVLNIANSGAYGLRREITSLEHAVTLLGAHSVRTIALSFSIVRGLRKSDSDGLDLSKLWRRALISGVAARSLGQHLEVNNQEGLFLSALLQDIGVLALRQAFPQSYGQLLTESEGDHARLVELERTEWGEEHAFVSGWLAQQWNLPEIYVLSLRGSHDPDQVEVTSDLRGIVQTVAVSGPLADVWVSKDLLQATANAKTAAKQILNMDGEDLNQILSSLTEALPEVSSLFEIDLGDAETLNEIAERAQETLLTATMDTVRHAQQAQMKATELESENQDLKERSARDSMTGVYSRAYLEEALGREFDWANERGHSLTVVFCDIDNFKQINDTHGHQVGDQIISSVARTLKSQLRQHDVVARYGGDEFVLLLTERDTAEVGSVCRRICNAVASQPLDISLADSAQFTKMTVSLGHATQSPQKEFKTAELLLHAADKALYEAKGAGGGQAAAYSSPDRPPEAAMLSS